MAGADAGADQVGGAEVAASEVPAPVTSAPSAPPEAVAIFGGALPMARRYADLLATTGISHGLVGPREAGRLWERHLVNCAAMAPLLQRDSSVIDIGSGAGLPGIVLAIARPDLQVHLVEPLLRRTTWLQSALDELGLGNVTVHRGRADEMQGLTAPVVTARAVASLEKLVTWGFPLLTPGGRLLALKGAAAAAELEAIRPALVQVGVEHSALHVLGEDEISEPVRVVEIERPEQIRALQTPGTTRAGGTKSARRGSRSRPRTGRR